MRCNLVKKIAGKCYRMGFTTGTCAAAAAKAAACMLIGQNKIREIEVRLPSSDTLVLAVENIKIEKDFVSCSVRKSAGDDMDVTDGISIFAQVKWNTLNRVIIEGGKGVGRVTKAGLYTAVGQAAINPKPMEMIQNSVFEVLPKGTGITIVISVPGGEEIAKKTLNPRLGIEGGISILGTSGIVSPMSEEAWRDSIYAELEMKYRQGYRHICFVFGKYGEQFVCEKLALPRESVIMISNFVGYMLDSAVNLGFSSILLVGHMGKIIKLAGGIFHTHSKVADGRMEILCTLAALRGARTEIVKEIYDCVTTNAAQEVIVRNGYCIVFEDAAQKVQEKMEQRVGGAIQCGCILFQNGNKWVTQSPASQKIIDYIRNDRIE